MVNSHIVHILTHDYFEVCLQSRQVELHAFALNFRAGSILHFCLFIYWSPELSVFQKQNIPHHNAANSQKAETFIITRKM